MNIVLDTNIFIRDLFMTSKHFELLFDYLEKTKSRIILPRIVYEELCERYRGRLTSHVEALAIAQRKVERALLRSEPPPAPIDVERAVGEYLEYVLDKLGTTESEIVPHRANYLDKLVTRSVKRLKPFSDKGEEFRDALLWLSVLDIAHDLCEGTVVFISADGRAFGSTKALHDELQEESQRRNVHVRYYESIKTFIEDHAAQVEFIDRTWLLQVVDFERFDEEISQRLAEQLEDARSVSYISSKRREWEGLQFQGDVSRAAEVDPDSISDFYAYEMADGAFYTEVVYYLEYEVGFFREEHVDEEMRSWFALFPDCADDFDEDHVIRRKLEYKYAEAEIAFGVTLKDGKVTEVELVGVWI